MDKVISEERPLLGEGYEKNYQENIFLNDEEISLHLAAGIGLFIWIYALKTKGKCECGWRFNREDTVRFTKEE